MERWSGRVALVTGASQGIGTAICKKLVHHGLNVIGIARDIDKLNQIASQINENSSSSAAFKPLKCDLRNESDINKVFNEIESQFGRIDICINNAGLANDAPLISGSFDAWKEMTDVNVLALSLCTRQSIQLMLKKNINDGHIIHLNSMSGHRVVPSAASHFYSATKFAVTALTEGLRQELRELKSEIRVTQISPGFVETEFLYRMLKDDKKAAETYSSLTCLQADDIAQVVIDVLKMPPHVEINDVFIRPTQQRS